MTNITDGRKLPFTFKNRPRKNVIFNMSRLKKQGILPSRPTALMIEMDQNVG